MSRFLKIFYITSTLLTANFLFFIFHSANPVIPAEEEQNKNIVLKEEESQEEVFIALAEDIEEVVPEEATSTEEVLVVKNVLFPVPFITQAPSGDWKNEVFQDGCEEANMLMAMRWTQNATITPEIARDEIIAISNFEEKEIGDYRDAGIADTAKIIEKYFNYKNIVVKNNVTLKDIIDELMRGNIIIAPMNGQKLNNPFYTPPGPINHMLTIIGYDAARKEFIVNDSGTKRGSKYRYPEKILYSALRDYPTGFQEDNPNEYKNIIVIKK